MLLVDRLFFDLQCVTLACGIVLVIAFTIVLLGLAFFPLLASWYSLEDRH